MYVLYDIIRHMRRKNYPWIILIILFLLLNGVLLSWMLSDRHRALEQDAETALAAEDIGQAARTVSDTMEKAQARIEKDLARAEAARHVIAHRGASGASLEHSFTTYDAAVRDGASMIEQDIVISADGTLYVSHDMNASRMTGVNRAFSDMTDAEIDQLRTYAGEKTLRLSEVFDRYGESITYVTELKDTDQRTIDAFVSLVEEYGYQDHIIVQCLFLDTLRILENSFPDMPKMYLCRSQDSVNNGTATEEIDIISVEDFLMTEDNARKVRDSGKQFSAWTLQSEDQIRRAIDLGAVNYFTDNVKLALSLEEEYGYEKRHEK